jgi:hypothetical protein
MLRFGSKADTGGEGIVDQEDVRLYASYRFWHCWHTQALLRYTGCDFEVFGTGDDAEPGASQAPFMEEEDRR